MAQTFDRVAVLDSGRITLEGSPAEVFAEAAWPILRSAGLEPPAAAVTGARLGLAKLYESLDRIDQAVETAREVPEANPGYALGTLQAAVIMDRHGYTDDAIALVHSTKDRLAPWMHHMIERDENLRALWEKAQ